MKIIEKYTGEKVYMYPNGTIADKKTVLQNTPAALIFTHIVETDENGEVLWALQNLSAMRTMYGINSELSEEEAIDAIQKFINTPQEIDDLPSAEERIAAALEYQVMTTMADSEEI